MLHEISTAIATTTKGITAKIATGGVIVIYSFLFSIESFELLIALIVLTGFDMITGIFASKKTGKQIESRKAARTAFKMAVYGLLVSSGHLTDSVIGLSPGWLSAETALLAFLAATELISILENAGRMGFGVPKKILNQLHKYTD